MGAAGIGAALGVLGSGKSIVAEFPKLLPFAGITIRLDPLGAWFTLTAGVIVVVASLYGIGYADHALRTRAIQAIFPLFCLSLLLVPAASSVSTFLVFWELMALTSLLLVATEHRERASARTAAVWYGVMTHLGFVAILVALALLAGQVGGESFAAMRAGAAHVPAGWQSVVFLLALVGFGSKAGIVPLHVWLPRAHPESPSHVSALMSGVMVTLGVYGIMRVGLDILGGGPRWWGFVVLALGAGSALFGILHALVASDLKVLLAYSTTENMGLVLIGVGAAMLLGAEHATPLVGVLLAASLLLVLNHALFKGLLFLGAGSVLRATGTRNLDELGGLVRRLPVTGALFGVGALAIVALPPLNGFVSEWMLFQGLVAGGGSHVASAAVTMPLAVGVVALTAGLAAATFVKAFGTGFLALPRSPAAAEARESPGTMLAAMGLLALGCAALGVAPSLLSTQLDRAVRATGTGVLHRPVSVERGVLHLGGVRGVISPTLIALLLAGGVVAVLAVMRLTISARDRRRAENWGCGRALQTARMEYTASSFAEPLQRVFDDVLRPDLDIDVTHADESRWYERTIRLRAGVRDGIEDHVYRPVLRAYRAWGERARAVQNGSVHRYLAYAFVALIVGLLVAR